MTIEVKVVSDSISPLKSRLTTFALRYPRFIHAEFMTHRVFSRNASSSRAIPVKKMFKVIQDDPALPVHWGKNQKGMQADEEVDNFTAEVCRSMWLDARDKVLDIASSLEGMGIHKQVVNRLLEPWSHISVVVTATEWDNFFMLRCHPDAQPEIRRLAEQMRDVYYSRIPARVDYGQWHLPFIKDTERLAPGHHGRPKNENNLVKASTARCARVSYLTHDNKDPVLDEDVALHDRLVASKHMSPTEHPATPASSLDFCGNFKGWIQYRKMLKNENCTSYNPPVKGV